MIIADTSVWIDFLRDTNSDFSDILKMYLKRNDVYAVSVVFGELLQGVKNKREKDIVLTLWENLPKPNEYNLFVKAGLLSNKYKLYAKGVGLIDCYIMAVAQENDFALWTLDQKLKEAMDIVSG